MSSRRDLLKIKETFKDLATKYGDGTEENPIIIRESAYCVDCKKYHEAFVEQCDCGSKNFAYGDISPYEEGFSCSCKKNDFELVFHTHLEGGTISLMIYKCKDCGVLYGVETFGKFGI